MGIPWELSFRISFGKENVDMKLRELDGGRSWYENWPYMKWLESTTYSPTETKEICKPTTRWNTMNPQPRIEYYATREDQRSR
jgi:hypothetical protein